MSERYPAIITWDWKEQPDFSVIASCIRSCSLNRCDARLVDTGTDEYSLVIHDHPLTAEEAQRWYDTQSEWDRPIW